MMRTISRGALGATAKTLRHVRRSKQPLSTSFMRVRQQEPERMVWLLVGTNVAVWCNWQYPLLPTAWFVATTRQVFDQFNIVPLAMASLSHLDLGHLVANMIGLYFFGLHVATSTSARFLLGLYLGAGTVSHFVQVSLGLQNRMNAYSLGASGAVSGLVAFSVLTNPYSTILLFGLIPIPAYLFGPAFILGEVYGTAGASRGSGLGHQGSLAGAAVGGLSWLVLRRRGRW